MSQPNMCVCVCVGGGGGGGGGSRHHMVVGFYIFLCNQCEFESRSYRDVLDTTLCDKVYQRLATGMWFSPGPPVSHTNKTGLHDITQKCR